MQFGSPSHCQPPLLLRDSVAPRLTVRRPVASRIFADTSFGQASKRAATARRSWSQSLLDADFSASRALCLTRTGMEPNRSRTVTRVPWGKARTICPGNAGVWRVNALELWIVRELCELCSACCDATVNRDSAATDVRKAPCLPWQSDRGGYFEVSGDS